MTITYTRPKLHPKQLAFVDDPARFTWVEAGTKSGKTTGMIVWLHEQVIKSNLNSANFWWVAPYHTTTDIAFSRLWSFIPQDARLLFSKNETQKTITYPDGKKVWFKSAEKPDTLYGEDVHAAVVDEASRMREESWHAVRSVLTATVGKAKIIGNVKGKKNWFYQNAQRAKASGIGYHKLTSYDNPFLSQAEIDDAKRQLPESVFKELYLAIPTDDGANPFGINHIHGCVKELSKKPPMFFGIDLAKSYDYTVIIGLDVDRNVSYFERFQKDWMQTTDFVANIPDFNKALIDSTGVGDPIAEAVQKTRHIEGFKFTQASKQQLMEGLAKSIQSKEIGFPNGVIVDELESFEFINTRTGVRYSAPDGQHDDCVCALALANMAAENKFSYDSAYG